MATAASDKKGIDIVTIKMRKISGICDYFVIASGSSSTQVRAISDHIIRQLRDKGERLRHVEGEREASWILIDFGDVVGHVFLDKTRKFYDLEKLWAAAPQARHEEPHLSKASLEGRNKPRRTEAKKRKLVKKTLKKVTKKIVKATRKKARSKGSKGTVKSARRAVARRGRR